MKHIALALLMLISIGISVPSIDTERKENVQTIEDVFETGSVALTSAIGELPSDGINAAVKPFTPPVNKTLYLKHYFSNLYDNFGENVYGTCAYIALSMILSYYDSYLCDDIIPEEYDVASKGTGTDMIERGISPGTLYEFTGNEYEIFLIENGRLTKEGYYNYTLQKAKEKSKSKTKSLQLKLIDLANLRGYEFVDNTYSDYGISLGQAFVVIQDYLNSVVGYDFGTHYTIDYCVDANENNVRQFIIEEIDKGCPVFVSGFNKKNSGHAFVCYDYDSIDKIYGHIGWHDKSTRYDVFSEYGNNIAAFSVNFNIEHSHSYNYMVGSTAYCYCDEAITYHRHSYGNSQKVDKQYHISYCECGKTSKSMHWVKGPTTGRYANCAACGASIDLWSDVVIGTMSLSKSPNGSYIHPSGIPIVMEEDVEAFLNGTLRFGSGISNYDYI